MPFFNGFINIIEKGDLQKCIEYYNDRITIVDDKIVTRESPFPIYTYTDHYQCILKAIECGYVDILKWLIYDDNVQYDVINDENDETEDISFYELFIHSVKYNQLAIAKWLVDDDDQGQIHEIYPTLPDIKKSEEELKIFDYTLIQHENIEFAQFFVDNFPMYHIQDTLEAVFYSCIEKKKINSCKWIIDEQEGRIFSKLKDNNFKRRDVYKAICRFGNAELLEWFSNLSSGLCADDVSIDAQIDGVDLRLWNNLDFIQGARSAIIYNNLDIYYYLIEKYPNNDKFYLDFPEDFQDAINNGSIESINIAQSFYPEITRHIHTFSKKFLRTKCLTYIKHLFKISVSDWVDDNVLKLSSPQSFQDLLIQACYNPDINVFIWIYNLGIKHNPNAVKRNVNYIVVLSTLIENNKLNTIIWMNENIIKFGRSTQDDRQNEPKLLTYTVTNLFVDACNNFNYNIAYWIYENNMKYVDLKCHMNIPGVGEYYYPVYQEDEYNYPDEEIDRSSLRYSPISKGLGILLDIICHNENTSEVCCTLDQFIQFYVLILTIDPTTNIHVRDEILFRFSCIYDRYSIGRFLLEFNHNDIGISDSTIIDIGVSDSTILRNLVEDNTTELETIKWLFYLKPDLYVPYDIFVFAIEAENLDIIKLIHSKNPNNINNLTPLVFQELCEDHEDIDIIHWILETRPSFDITTDDHNAFRIACEYEDYPLARLLCDHEPDIYSIFNVDYSNGGTTFQHCIKTSFKPRDQIILYNDTDIDDCPICYSTKSNVITDCKHMYCFDCLKLHVQTNNSTCPMCRVNISAKKICWIATPSGDTSPKITQYEKDNPG